MTNSMARWGGQGWNGWHTSTPVPDSYTSGLTITYLGVYKAGRKTSSFTSSAFSPKSQNLDSFLTYTRLVLINYSKPKGKGKGF